MLDISNISKRSLLGRILRKSLNLFIPKDAVVPILQGPAKGMKWLTGSSVNACWLGSYEVRKQQQIKRYLQSGMVAYDIGAHVGFYTLMFARLVGPTGKVYAFEPLPENFRVLQKHLELNNLNNVIIEPVAVSDKNEEIIFYKNTETYMGNIVEDNEKLIGNIKVFSTTVDQYNRIGNNPPPDFLKIDVEGAESLVLTGMERLMNEKKPILFLALHGEEVAKECLIILRKHNYKTLDLQGNNIDISQTYTDEIIAL